MRLHSIAVGKKSPNPYQWNSNPRSVIDTVLPQAVYSRVPRKIDPLLHSQKTVLYVILSSSAKYELNWLTLTH